MPRGKQITKEAKEPDSKYKSKVVAKFINMVMNSGKKSLAQKIVYNALESVNKDDVKEARVYFEDAVKNLMPEVEVRSRRAGGANYQIPREVRPERRQFLSMKWIIDAARAKKGKPMHEKLAEEIIAASNNEGDAVRKRENTHKMAEANKAFAHFAW